MNKKKLNLDIVADEIIRVLYPTYEQAIPGMKNAIIQKKLRIKQILEYHIKSVCEFYLKYKDKPDLLGWDHPLLIDKIDEIYKKRIEAEEALGPNYKPNNTFTDEYNEWLFKFRFRDI